MNPHALAVMAESGIDISGHVSHTIDELTVKKFDYVVTLCDSALRSAVPHSEYARRR